jgi:hypothetical protein
MASLAGLVPTLLAGVAALAVASCVVTSTAAPARGIVVSGPPPAVIREELPPAPTSMATWVAGYWHWTGIQYAWIPGHWVAAPPTGAVWRAPTYVQNNGVYFYEPGGWGAVAPRQAPASAPPTAAAFH